MGIKIDIFSLHHTFITVIFECCFHFFIFNVRLHAAEIKFSDHFIGVRRSFLYVITGQFYFFFNSLPRLGFLGKCVFVFSLIFFL